MKFLNTGDILCYENYKYKSEDNCFLTKYYCKGWNYISIFIPRYIHPNIITLMGLFFILCGYYLGSKSDNYSNIFMGLGIIGYTNFDGIDGIHARNTKQTSIIGEYIDHSIDLIACGFISTWILNMLGIRDIIYNNLIIFYIGFDFFMNHLYATNTKKIIFSGTSDVSAILTLSTLVVFLDLKLPNIMIDNIYILLIGFGIFSLNNICKYYFWAKNDHSYKNFSNVYLCYWAIKLFTLVHRPTQIPWSILIVDLPLLLETINLKIFSRQLFNQYLLLGLPILYIYWNVFAYLLVILYMIYFIISISNQLNINIVSNLPSEYLPRVYCCGVFDMCHLGHMKLFEKIANSFDHPIWLIVGVHSDSTVKSYKREPIINEKLRIETIKLCKYVDSVYPDAELIVTKEFCLDNRIDYVIIGEEYKDNKDKIWYAGGMELNIHKYVSRFDEISTTDIIKKIKANE